VREAVVLAREDVPGEKRLVGYVTLHEQQASAAEHLQEQLREVLPEYMVPSALVVLESLPLTPNGKVDRKALQPPEQVQSPVAYEAPQGEIELTLARIWQELLGIESVGRGDNFFTLGGHSLLATRVVERVRQELGAELPLQLLFAEPTIRMLSTRLLENRGTETDSDELLQQVALLSDDEVAELLQVKRRDSVGSSTTI